MDQKSAKNVDGLSREDNRPKTSRQSSPNNSEHVSNRGQPAIGATRTPNLQSAPPQRPQYSLSGNLTHAHGPSFVDPGYHELNPGYQKAKNTPVWGLAKPLPRVVRAGMRRGRDGQVVEDKEAGRDAPGSSEQIPQLGMIDEQRQDAGKDPAKEQHDEQRGYGHERVELRESRGTTQRATSENSVVEKYGTPPIEKSDPMENWSSRGSFYGRHTKRFVDEDADIGDGRLSRVQEVPSQETSPAVSISDDGDSNDIDLEAANSMKEWPVHEGEATELAQEAYDNHNLWSSIRAKFREPLAECLATMIYVLIGLCTDLAVQTSANTAGIYLSKNWAWGLGVMVGIYIAGGISGAHLNPAISLMLSACRGFPLRKVAVYIAAQVLGAFLAGLIAYGIYRDAIISFDAKGGETALEGGSSQALGLFSGGSGSAFYTQPKSFVGVGGAFANEFVATAILACAILALGDDSNAPPGAGMHAMIVGLVVAVLCMAFGYISGGCMNPARDLGPRLATAAVGYGWEVFTVDRAWWLYGAWGATIAGALVGGFLYDIFIFVGGESPVNYPRSRRKRIKNKAKRRWFGTKRVVEKGLKGQLVKSG